MAHLKDLIVNGASRFIGKAYGVFVGTFNGNLIGNADTATKLQTSRTISLTGNASGSATFDGSGNISINTNVNYSTTSARVIGYYTGNGGQQGPGYFGKERAGCLMSNAIVRGHSEYKNWLYMDNYSGTNVGGATAIGVSRQEMRAYIMRSNADRATWNDSAELLSSANYNEFAPTKTGAGASGTWPISISGNAATATTATKANGLTGSLNFPDIGDVATSNKISWNGSTDGADIYYQTTASDQRNLVLNLRDDANCYLRIAYNGAFKSYFTPADGNFHGNVNGKSDSAGSADTSAAINYSNIGTNYIKAGSADTGDAANQTANMVIGSWYGITFYDVCGNKIAGGMNVRDGSLTMKGTITGSKVYNAVYNDYAEFFEKDEDTAFEAGDIVALDTNSEEERYIKATEDSIVVVGVCTHEYAHIIGGKGQTIEENEKEFVPISLMGRVHVKVDDTVKRGDKVTASKVPGIGRKAMPGEHSIGTALTNPSNGKVRVLINL